MLLLYRSLVTRKPLRDGLASGKLHVLVGGAGGGEGVDHVLLLGQLGKGLIEDSSGSPKVRLAPIAQQRPHQARAFAPEVEGSVALQALGQGCFFNAADDMALFMAGFVEVPHQR